MRNGGLYNVISAQYDRRLAGEINYFFCAAVNDRKFVSAVLYNCGRCHCRAGAWGFRNRGRGGAEWIIWMIQGIIQGFTQGFSIQMAHEFGARDYKRLRNVIVNSAFLAAISAFVLLAAGQVLAKWLLGVLNTPDAVFAEASLYIRTMFWGIPVVMAYNLFAGVLRSLGDGKTPLYAMVLLLY